MNRRRNHTPRSTPDVLELWMGEPEDGGPPRHVLRRRFFLALVVVAGAVGVVMLAKYAPDILPILLALLTAGLVLRVLGRRLARSSLLSPGSLGIIAFGAALLAYAVLAPDIDFSALARHLPQRVVDFFR